LSIGCLTAAMCCAAAKQFKDLIYRSRSRYKNERQKMSSTGSGRTQWDLWALADQTWGRDPAVVPECLWDTSAAQLFTTAADREAKPEEGTGEATSQPLQHQPHEGGINDPEDNNTGSSAPNSSDEDFSSDQEQEDSRPVLDLSADSPPHKVRTTAAVRATHCRLCCELWPVCLFACQFARQHVILC
jgi:hypothetical protein